MIERRKHRRIVTLKNFAWLMIALLVIFAGLSIDRSVRGENGTFGRIMDGQIATNDDIRPKPQVVIEAPPVADQKVADPMLLAPMAREQEFLSTAPVTPPPAPVAAAQMAAPVETRGSGVSIVGGADGVTLVRNGEAKKPVLAGGVFKQP